MYRMYVCIMYVYICLCVSVCMYIYTHRHTHEFQSVPLERRREVGQSDKEAAKGKERWNVGESAVKKRLKIGPEIGGWKVGGAACKL